MKNKISLLILFLTVLARADDQMIQRRWTIPNLTPIIEINPNADPNDPFDKPSLKSIEVYSDKDIQKWLEANGVNFPESSKVFPLKNEYGHSVLNVKNTAENLELIDDVLSKHHSTHTSLQLMKKFISETNEQPTAKLLPVLQRYPAQTLGPLRNIAEELQQLNSQLAANPSPELKKIISKRKSRLSKIFPTSLKATRLYFQTLVQAMEAAE